MSRQQGDKSKNSISSFTTIIAKGNTHEISVRERKWRILNQIFETPHEGFTLFQLDNGKISCRKEITLHSENSNSVLAAKIGVQLKKLNSQINVNILILLLCNN